jgi:phage gpG-like protein
MSDDTGIRVDVVGEESTLRGLRLRKAAMAKASLKALRLSSEIVLAKATEKVSGAVLKVQTGTLRRRLTYRVSAEEGLSRVGSPTIYAPRHEFGFHGLEVVPAHQRHITHAFGKRLKGRGGLTVYVGWYVRRANTPERPFMRPSLAESREQIEAVFQRSMAEAVAGLGAAEAPAP